MVRDLLLPEVVWSLFQMSDSIMFVLRNKITFNYQRSILILLEHLDNLTVFG